MTQDPVLGRRVWSDRQLRQRLAEDEARAGQSGSGGSAGSPIRFPFQFDTPGLEAGVEIYTPTIGEILLDGWIEIITVWDDGTTLSNSGPAAADVGMFINGSFGWFKTFSTGPVPLSSDHLGFPYPGAWIEGITAAQRDLGLTAFSQASLALLENQDDPTRLAEIFPVRFVSTDPVLLVVSNNGVQLSGPAEGGSATQGEAVLYLVTAPA